MEQVEKYKPSPFRWVRWLMYSIVGLFALFIAIGIIVDPESPEDRLAREALEQQNAGALYPKNMLESVKGEIGNIGGELFIEEQSKNIIKYKLIYSSIDLKKHSLVSMHFKLIIDATIKVLMQNSVNPDSKHSNIVITVNAESPKKTSPTGVQPPPDIYTPLSVNYYYDPKYPVNLVELINSDLKSKNGLISIVRMEENSLKFEFMYDLVGKLPSSQAEKDAKEIVQLIISKLMNADLNPRSDDWGWGGIFINVDLKSRLPDHNNLKMVQNYGGAFYLPSADEIEWESRYNTSYQDS